MRKTLRQFLLLAGLLTLYVQSFAQNPDKTITGTVRDTEGLSLPGASVQVKGTSLGTQTDANGKYALKVPATAKVLVFTFLGTNPKEVAIGTNTVINVTLTSANKTLDDVVVIGYGAIRRADVTTSISSINEKDIKNLPVSGVDQALQGKIAGITVSNNGGQPGGGVSVKVRGITSVNGTQPLYVVDGVPIMTSTNSIAQDQLGGKAGQSEQSVLSTLNPNDILSVDVLKDASAQAIYGSLGGNGVVLITTKKGRANEGKINYDVYFGAADVPNKLDIMNLRQYAQYYNSLIPEVAAASPGSQLPVIGELQNPDVLGEGTDWQSALFKNGYTQNHQLSFSGGAEKTNYFFSVNYFDQEGTIIGSGFDRLASRFALDHQVRPWLKAGITGNLSRSNQKIALTDGTETPTTIVLYNSPATPIKDANGNFITTSSLGANTFGQANSNPIATATLRDVRAIQNKAFGNIYAEIKFTDWLNLRNEANYDFQLGQNSAFQPNVVNQNTKQTILAPSRLREDRNNSHYWALRNYVNINKGFANKHWINFTLGHEAQASYYSGTWVSATDLNQNMPSINAGIVDPAATNSNVYEWAMESYFARGGYTYNDRYSISASYRRDGSSSFGPEKKWGSFAGVSAAWTVTNEEFAKNWKGIDYLKIRLGYGSVGNQNSPVQNAYSTNIRLFSIAPFGKGGVPANVGNPFLSWESVVTQNAGVDLTVLNKRLELSVDVYNKTTTDMILATTLPVFAGLDPNPPANAYKEIEPPVTNAGEMNNKGIDIGLTSYNIQRKDFSWKTNVVLSAYRNELVRLNSPNAILRGAEQDFTGSTSVVNITKAGHPVGTFYGYVTDGLFRDLSELNNGTNWGIAVGPTGLYLGDVRYKDISGPNGTPDGKIGSEDVTIIGDPNPDFTYGITNTLQYKNFDFSLFLQGVQGSQIFNWTRKYTESLSNAYLNQSTTVLNRYTSNNTTSDMPRFVNNWHSNNTRNSDRYIEDGSYLRIQNVSIGYNLPQKWANAFKATSARIYVSGQNLHTFTKYSGYDPEIGSFNKSVLTQNVDNGHYPTPRTFTIGANIQF
ncbi:SusC/RagA family TonB-linked outer membrane protein [Pelobium manganitolerans]|uniref:SusC/RagA family TonB-linked outer membrane protein n=1 Tax=Pelobium manganitolerans TaxID=1842495 RepID=A0A419SBQ7_9SPHI|nr:TonB-dependent receptor [Pelobium manganitolerans]RKD20227.1 SusC/RagA family TonB-linked outer membrane protein [Pelobium manganitolerans]